MEEGWGELGMLERTWVGFRRRDLIVGDGGSGDVGHHSAIAFYLHHRKRGERHPRRANRRVGCRFLVPGPQSSAHRFQHRFGLPPVVIGLVLSILLLRHGPLGWLNLRFTPTAMVIAQFILCLPIAISLTAVAALPGNPTPRFQIRAPRAPPLHHTWVSRRANHLSH